MASSASSAKTAPKGHATKRQGADEAGSFFGPTMQWTVLVIVALAVIGAFLYLTRDVSSNLGGGGHSGAPASVVVDVDALSGA